MQKDFTTLTIYAANSDVLNFIKNELPDLKIQININPTIVGDFNMLLCIIDKPSRKTK